MRLLDYAEAVYSASSASELGNCRHLTSLMLMSTARHELKYCIMDRHRLRKPCEGMNGRFPPRPAAEQVVNVAQLMLR